MSSDFAFKKTSIDGLLIIEPFVAEDERGYYIKSYERDVFRQNGINIGVQEICGSVSHRGVLRGLHYQKKEAQSKVVRCAFGRLFDVSVDLRKNSSTYGQWFGTEISYKNNKMLYIPPGFAHGTFALSEDAVLVYHSAEKYLRDYDAGIRWDDPTISIEWPLSEGNVTHPILSEKDGVLPFLSEINIELNGQDEN